MHDALTEDLRVRVADIARGKGIDLVLGAYEAAGTAVDLTADVIDSYGRSK